MYLYVDFIGEIKNPNKKRKINSTNSDLRVVIRLSNRSTMNSTTHNQNKKKNWEEIAHSCIISIENTSTKNIDKIGQKHTQKIEGDQ